MLGLASNFSTFSITPGGARGRARPHPCLLQVVGQHGKEGEEGTEARGGVVAGNGSNVFRMGLRTLKGWVFFFKGEMQAKSCEVGPKNA